MAGPWEQYQTPAAAGPRQGQGEHGFTPAPPPAEDDKKPDVAAAPPPDLPTAEQFLHNLGLGTRNVAEGLTALGAPVLDALTWPMRAGQRAVGIPTTAPSDLVTKALDAGGLPTPATPQEELNAATIRGVSSVLPTVGAGFIPSVVRAAPTVANALSSAIWPQIAGGGAAGTAGEVARREGYGPWAQLGISTLAGVAAGGAAGARPGRPGPGPRVNQAMPPPGPSGEMVAPNAVPPTNPLAPAAPTFVPPGTPAPPLPRILELLQADDRMAASRPAEIPPTSTTDATGNTVPIQQPANPIDQTGASRVAPAAETEPGGAAGAAPSPPAAAALSPAQEAMYRSQAEQTKLLEPQQPGVPDLNQYVDKSNPTEAHIEQTVEAAREDKANRNIDTAVSQEARELADRNNTARQNHYQDTAGSQYQVQAAEAAREAQLEQDLEAAWRNKGEADAEPVRALAQSILDGPGGKTDAVARVVGNVLGKLHDKTGNLETDPKILWGVRRQINNLLSKESAVEQPTNQQAARELMQIREALDKQIEGAAPGFGKAISNFAEASRPIDAMELLQKQEAGLYDSQNRMQYSRVQRMMREAVAARHPNAPLNPWQSISDEQMTRLWALRDDLRRVAASDDLAAARGSDSVPNAIDVAKKFAGIGLNAIPVLGPIAFRARAALDPIVKARAAQRVRARGMEMLHPDPEKYPLRNPLGPPP